MAVALNIKSIKLLEKLGLTYKNDYTEEGKLLSLYSISVK